MLLLRLLPALLLLLLPCSSSVRLRGSRTQVQGRSDSRSMMELIQRTGRPPVGSPRHGPPQRRVKGHHGAESHRRDPDHKMKFITHLTGPLNFNVKCRKHFHRLYHKTRDCTEPTYYKRCARLLTQLANSPLCRVR
ncbi:ALK and LTK ligand 1-like [Pholidichthys leucotaenia]